MNKRVNSSLSSLLSVIEPMARKQKHMLVGLAEAVSPKFKPAKRRKRKARRVAQFNRLAYVVLAIAVLAAFLSTWRWSTATVIVAACLVVAFAVAMALIIRSLLKRRWEKRWLQGVEMAAIDAMDGYQFEKTCAELFRSYGYDVEVTKKARDQGADLIVSDDEDRTVVQTKRQQTPVGNWAVQEVVAAKALYKANRAIVITNSSYTPQAVSLAHANDVELLDRGDLASLLASTKQKANSA